MKLKLLLVILLSSLYQTNSYTYMYTYMYNICIVFSTPAWKRVTQQVYMRLCRQYMLQQIFTTYQFQLFLHNNKTTCINNNFCYSKSTPPYATLITNNIVSKHKQLQACTTCNKIIIKNCFRIKNIKTNVGSSVLIIEF